MQLHLLKQLSTFLTQKGAVFILAADRHQLENSAKTAFGIELDFEEYYRKFVHREVTLPPISDTGYANLARIYVSYYLEREGARFCYMQLDHNRIENISELFGALKLTPRQILLASRDVLPRCFVCDRVPQASRRYGMPLSLSVRLLEE